MAGIPQYDPQLAQLVKEAPSGAEWLHELKYDGYRIGCRIDGRSVTLLSRNGKDWTEAFPEIVRAAQSLRVKSALLDGEVCVVLPDGRTSFQGLQNLAAADRSRLVYFVFDLIYLDGRSLAAEPLEARKAALKKIVRGERIKFSEHLDADGPEAHREACRLRLEGIVSKPRNAPYQSGKRVGWLKTKCVSRQEFVIGGFTDPEGSREGIGAILVGVYDGGRLRFAGKVGTGFTVKSARELRTTLNRLEIPSSPFTPPPPGWLGRNAHWVKPALVGEVEFTEWTGDGKIRHPSFQGLRRDKPPEAVVREVADAAPAPARTPGRRRARRPPAAAGPRPSVRGIGISHPDRVMYERPRLTKLEVAQYYDRIAEAMMPHVDGRPLTLVRCGEGIAHGCFYMKHSKVWSPPALRRVKIREKTKIGEYLVIESPEAIVSLVQMDILEIHTWNTRHQKIEHPDRIVLDLDPGPEVEWKTVVSSARAVRKLLQTLDLESFVKTTGGRGLHVVVPLAPVHDWAACLDLSRAVAEALTRHDPGLFTTTFSKRGRERQILVDYMRNNRTNTSVAAFSTRAREGAPVSMPVSWTELTPSLDPASFTAVSVPQRLARQRKDPWAEYFTLKQRFSKKAVASV
ncbi:MAG TPA: DNA ligase D [Vicinamibacterales bacterium]|nr:DNA ligase D [Vicinamibacterales bacterium]